jgi:N-methylhydantoinase A
MSFTIGIDVGGTFTDIVVAGPDGAVIIAKAPTTPADQSDGVLAGIALAAGRLGRDAASLLAETGRIVHGTTVATNALLEGKTALMGMLTTEGHRDIIEMREGLKPDRYNLRMTPPRPLVSRRLRLGVRERVRADGSVAGAGCGLLGRRAGCAGGGQGAGGGGVFPARLAQHSA